MSSAKNTPAAIMMAQLRRENPVSGWRFTRARSISSGTARKSRQKPAETGPVSARRTGHEPIASTTLPPIKATKWSAFQFDLAPVAFPIAMP